MANPQNLKPFTGADDPRRVNGAPKGTKHISTWIQEMMNDNEFETQVLDSKTGWKDYKGAPLKAIIQVAAKQALAGDDKAREWLAKHGWKAQLDITSAGEQIVFGNSVPRPKE